MQPFNLQQLNEYILHSKFTIEKHPKADLFIYGYESRKEANPIIWDDINIHLRGIILNSYGFVQSRPFKKFFTFKEYLTKSKVLLTERKSLRLPKCSFRIYEKVDGSMALLYWVDNIPYLASQRSFSSLNAIKATEILHSKYSHLFDQLRRDVTYVFEAIYPNTRVMVDYEKREDLILLGVIDNNTGIDLPIENIGFPMIKDYTNEYGHIDDLEELTNLNLPNLEGFVLHYENGLRLKLKFPWFTEAHMITSKIMWSEKMLCENKQQLSKLLNLPTQHLTNLTVWSCLSQGHSLEKILQYVPGEFYAYGFDLWLSEVVSSLQEKLNIERNNNPSQTEHELWELIKPQTTQIFDLKSRRGAAQHSTPMWNLVERVKKCYQ